jgi:uncharacterized Fe-S cluster-containing radical SAM superfamily protein
MAILPTVALLIPHSAVHIRSKIVHLEVEEFVSVRVKYPEYMFAKRLRVSSRKYFLKERVQMWLAQFPVGTLISEALEPLLDRILAKLGVFSYEPKVVGR